MLLPIHSLVHVLTPAVVEAMLRHKSCGEIDAAFGPHLPLQSCLLMDVVRSGFFQQALERLSECVRDGDGAGYLLSQSLGLPYRGEGIDAFLDSCRRSK